MPPKTEIALKRAKALRTGQLESLAHVEEFVNTKLASASLAEIKFNNNWLDEYYKDFQKNQTIIENLDEEDIILNERIKVDKLYYNLKPKIETKLEELKEAKSKIQKEVKHEELSFTPNLPTLEIEIFTGIRQKWKKFIESFDSHIHSNPKLNNITKYQYLLNLTAGEGAKPFESLDFVSDNYEEARLLLIDRFDRPNEIAVDHIRSLFSYKKIEKATSQNMLSLLDEFNSHLRSLKTLGRPTQYWDDLIIFLMVSKFDTETFAKWKEVAPTNSMPTYDDMSSFLKIRSQRLQGILLEKTSTIPSVTKSSRPSVAGTRSNSGRSSFHTIKNYNCVYCSKQGHSIMRCRTFIKMSIPERRTAVEKLKLCFNCLRESHFAEKCPNTENCHVCKSKHHTLLHLDLQPSSISSSSSNKLTTTSSIPTSQTTLPQSSNSCIAHSSTKYVMLATALIDVFDDFGDPHVCRALLDSGSQINFITTSFASKLGIKTSTNNIRIRGIGSSNSSSSRSATIRIKSRINQFSQIIDVQLLTSITDQQPITNFDISSWQIPPNIQLADPHFFKSGKIDLLLGADIFYQLQSVGQIQLHPNLPILQNTTLGWVITGSINEQIPSFLCNVASSVSESEVTNKLIEKFWNIECAPNISSIDKLSTDECNLHFESTYTRDLDLRFVVSLPFIKDAPELGDSMMMAQKRFFNLEKRLQKHPNLRSAYNEFMTEYLNLDHMELIDTKSVETPNYFLPHHCIEKPDSSSTKLRVVFDGSAKTTSKVSLNECLMSGPVVQNDIFAILLRFRAHSYAFSADIAKMYRQIKICEADQNYQLIFWRFQIDDPLQIYRLKTVTYGTTSAPFLATRCLLQLALDSQLEEPAASNSIRYDIYVDDLLSGSNSLEDTLSLQSTISTILNSAGMKLHKWCANDVKILQNISKNDREQLTQIDDGEFVKILGLYWESDSDIFRLKVNIPITSRITKRVVVSELARIFDPIGLVSPVVVYGKLFMQRLWQLKLDWDESLSMLLHTQWSEFRNELSKLNEVSIPRHLFNRNSFPGSIQLHGFADASERAYGAAIYVRSIVDKDICVRLLCSKSRVAPLKQTTLPRLELCAAQLLSNLMFKIQSIVNFSIENIFYWTDSAITLCWIQSQPTRWKTFIANRVSDIQTTSNQQDWRHIESKLNPADLISRGCQPESITNHGLWWCGPPFLQLTTESWRTSNTHQFKQMEAPESKKDPFVLTSVPEKTNPILDRLHTLTSSYQRYIRTASYIQRYIFNLQHPNEKIVGPLTSEEINSGTILVIRLVQMQCFPVIYNGLQNHDFVVRDSSLKPLSLFMDSHGVIRVGGRLQFSSISYTAKHPALLPHNHFFSLMLINFFHRKNMHVGPQGLLAIVRQQFWPINGRQLAKRICRECIMCSRARPRLLQQMMAPLPRDRVEIAPPFYKTGVDYAGPFYIHHHARGKVPIKTYLAVFVCLTTKAVHFELASDLSSASFLGAFRRFVSTRGMCRKIFSDNGTNFIGANTELHALYNMLNSDIFKKQLEGLTIEGISWKFLPAGSPHFGGLYESVVKSAKYHLRRVIGNANLNYEELHTIIKQAEATLNSRPLTHLGTDNELEVLTPGHFLIGRPLNAIPEPNISNDGNVKLKKRWELVQHLSNIFWSRWSKEYLQGLQKRYYWQNKQKNLTIGTIVIIQDENLPPLRWKLGKVIQLHPGPDNIVRVASIRTSSGTIKRAITKLAPLPIDIEPKEVQGGENDHDQLNIN